MNKEEFIKNIKELNLEINDEVLSKLDKSISINERHP